MFINYIERFFTSKLYSHASSVIIVVDVRHDVVY